MSHAFPSGIAELAERHELVLSEAAVVDDRHPSGAIEAVRAMRRRLQGRQWMPVGFATVGPPAVKRIQRGPRGFRCVGRLSGTDRFDGETFVYIVGRVKPFGG